MKSYKMMKTLLFLLFPIFSFAQVQLGQDIDGEAVGDFSGFSTSISSDGNILAVGAPFNDGNGSSSGHVRVFENQGGIWVQIGEDLDGEEGDDRMGRSVSLSGDGGIVAIGAERNDGNGTQSGHVRVLENQNGSWVQIGKDIDGEAINDLSGSSVSLSEDGSIVAVGAPGNSGGHVRVFENQGGPWIQIGENIEGEATFDLSGGSVAISANGTVLAIGAVFNSGNGSQAGHIRMYENKNDVWVQIGEDIDGLSAADFFGKAVAMSADGNIVAISSGGNTESVTDPGYVQVFENQNEAWVQIGEDIIGEAPGDVFNSSYGGNIALSSNGNILAIGARRNDGNGEDAGHVRIFVNVGDSWEQVGEDIDGEAVDDLSGHSVSMSADGTKVAIGARDNSGTGPSAGHVRVFDMSDFISSTITPEVTNFTIYPNPSTEQITIELEQYDILELVIIYNNFGQKVISSSNTVINISSLTPGIYSVQVATNKGRATKKITIQ